MKELSPPSASLVMIQSWEKWLTHQKAMLPFSETRAGWELGGEELDMVRQEHM